MPTEYFRSENGDDDLGYSWEIHKREEGSDQIRLMATCYTEKDAELILSGLKTIEAHMSGFMKLGLDGIVVDINKGTVWTPPKGKRTPSLRITSAKKTK